MKNILLLLLSVIVFSCSKNADFTKVKKGMSEKNVYELVGKPKDSSIIPFINAKIIKYENNVIVLLHGKVTRVETASSFVESIDSTRLKKDINKIDNAIEEYKKRKAQ